MKEKIDFAKVPYQYAMCVTYPEKFDAYIEDYDW